MRLYHSGSNLTVVENKGIFGGVFASADRAAAESHCGDLYYTDLNDDQIACSSDIDSDIALSTISSLSSDQDEIDALYDAIVFDRGLYSSEIDQNRICEIFNADDIANADWAAQKIRGEIAAKMGFRAIEMKDEHGTSYLVLPGVGFTK